MNETTYLVFGDLHGRVLPAFRFALAWSREHATPVAGILQVGDLGYFPDPSRLDKATRRHAEKDPLELGTQLVTEVNPQADALFAEPDVPERLWFTVGNHEDFEALQRLEPHGDPHGATFIVDAYCRVACLRDGQVASLPGPLRVGALWGIDDLSPNARRGTPQPARIRPRSATQLACAAFDVLLTHDSPLDGVHSGSGSEAISTIIRQAQPAFAFFGHYSGPGGRVEGDFGRTQVFHMAGMELRHRGGHAEDGSVGVLRWDGTAGTFRFVERAWLRTFTRQNWAYR